MLQGIDLFAHGSISRLGSTGFGATMASVSFAFAVGVGATTRAASSLVAALSELLGSSGEEDMVFMETKRILN